jgi:hypothetical protein
LTLVAGRAILPGAGSEITWAMKLNRLVSLVLIVALGGLVEGCATSALWEEGRFARYHEPADPPNLRLFYSTKARDALVEYDEANEANDSIKPRAFWLGQNQDRIAARCKPLFVSLESAGGLEPVTLRQPAAGIVPPPQGGLHATYATNSQVLELFVPGETRRVCELPVYRDASGRAKQVLLTPLTAAADLTIIGGVIGYLWLNSLTPGTYYTFH